MRFLPGRTASTYRSDWSSRDAYAITVAVLQQERCSDARLALQRYGDRILQDTCFGNLANVDSLNKLG